MSLPQPASGFLVHEAAAVKPTSLPAGYTLLPPGCFVCPALAGELRGPQALSFAQPRESACQVELTSQPASSSQQEGTLPCRAGRQRSHQTALMGSRRGSVLYPEV